MSRLETNFELTSLVDSDVSNFTSQIKLQFQKVSLRIIGPPHGRSFEILRGGVPTAKISKEKYEAQLEFSREVGASIQKHPSVGVYFLNSTESKSKFCVIKNTLTHILRHSNYMKDRCLS